MDQIYKLVLLLLIVSTVSNQPSLQSNKSTQLQLNKPVELQLNSNQTIKLNFSLSELMFQSNDAIIIRVVANSNKLFIKFYNTMICRTEPSCIMSMNYDQKQNQTNNGYNTNYIKVSRDKYLNNKQRHQNYTVEVYAQQQGSYQIVIEEKKEGQVNSIGLIFGSQSMVGHLQYQGGHYQPHFYEFYCPIDQQYFQVNVDTDNKYYQKYVRIQLFKKGDQQSILKQEMGGLLVFDKKDDEYVAGQMYSIKVELQIDGQQYDKSIQYQIQVANQDSMKVVNMNKQYHFWMKDDSEISVKLYVGDYKGSLTIISQIDNDDRIGYLRYQVGNSIFQHSGRQIYQQKQGLRLDYQSVEQLCKQQNNQCILYFNVVAGDPNKQNNVRSMLKFRFKILSDNYPIELTFNNGIHYDYRHIFDFEKLESHKQLFYMVPKKVKSYMVSLQSDLEIDIEYEMIKWKQNMISEMMERQKYRYKLSNVNKRYLNVREQDVMVCYPNCVYVIRISPASYMSSVVSKQSTTGPINININLQSSQLVAEYGQTYKLILDQHTTKLSQFYVPTAGFYQDQKTILISYSYKAGLHVKSKIYLEKKGGQISYIKADLVVDGFMVYISYEHLQDTIGCQVVVFSNYRTQVDMKIGLNIGHRIMMDQLTRLNLQKDQNINYMLLYVDRFSLQQQQQYNDVKVHFVDDCNSDGLVVGVKQCDSNRISDCDNGQDLITNLINKQQLAVFQQFHFYLLHFYIASSSTTKQINCEFYLDHQYNDFIRLFRNKVTADSLNYQQTRIFRIDNNRMQYQKLRVQIIEGMLSIDRKDHQMSQKYSSDQKIFEYYVDKVGLKQNYIDLEVQCSSLSGCVYKLEEMDRDITRVQMNQVYIQQQEQHIYYIPNIYSRSGQNSIYLSVVSSDQINLNAFKLELSSLNYIFQENVGSDPQSIKVQQPSIVYNHQNQYLKYNLEIEQNHISQLKVIQKQQLQELKLYFSHSQYSELVQFGQDFHQYGNQVVEIYMEQPLDIQKYHYRLSFWSCLGSIELKYYSSINNTIDQNVSNDTLKQIVQQIQGSENQLVNEAPLDSVTNMILDPLIDDQQGRLFVIDPITTTAQSRFKLERVPKNQKFIYDILEVKAEMDIVSNIYNHHVYIEPLECISQECHQYDFSNVDVYYSITVGAKQMVQFYGYCQSQISQQEFIDLNKQDLQLEHDLNYGYEDIQQAFKQISRQKKFNDRTRMRIKLGHNLNTYFDIYIHIRTILKGITHKTDKQNVGDVLYDYPLQVIFSAKDEDEDQDEDEDVPGYYRMSSLTQILSMITFFLGLTFITWLLFQITTRRNQIITYMRTKALYLQVRQLQQQENILQSNDQSSLVY